MSDYSAILKKYVINGAGYVDKKMQPLPTKADLDNFAAEHPLWMFAGLKVTVVEDEDGKMRDYRCEIVDGEKVWVPMNNVSDETLAEVISTLEATHIAIEEGYKAADAELEEKIEALETILSVQGNDTEK